MTCRSVDIIRRVGRAQGAVACPVSRRGIAETFRPPPSPSPTLRVRGTELRLRFPQMTIAATNIHGSPRTRSQSHPPFSSSLCSPFPPPPSLLWPSTTSLSVFSFPPLSGFYSYVILRPRRWNDKRIYCGRTREERAVFSLNVNFVPFKCDTSRLAKEMIDDNEVKKMIQLPYFRSSGSDRIHSRCDAFVRYWYWCTIFLPCSRSPNIAEVESFEAWLGQHQVEAKESEKTEM